MATQSRFLAGGKLRRGPTINPIGREVRTVFVNPSEPKGAKKMAKKKKRKSSSKKKKRGMTKAQQSAAGRKGARTRKKNASARSARGKKAARTRKSNPSKKRRSYKRKSNPKKRRSYRRKSNPAQIFHDDLSLDSVKKAVMPTVAAAAGFMAGGIIDAVGGGKVTESIAKIFAGKGKRPDYAARAKGRAVVDVGTFLGIWFVADKVMDKSGKWSNLKAPWIIGSGVRALRSVVDATLSPKPDTVWAGIRKVLALPPTRLKSLPAMTKIPTMAWFDPSQKAWVSEPAGVKLSVKMGPNGYLVDASTGSPVMDVDTGNVATSQKGLDGYVDIQPSGMGSYSDYGPADHQLTDGGMGSYSDYGEDDGMGMYQEDRHGFEAPF